MSVFEGNMLFSNYTYDHKFEVRLVLQYPGKNILERMRITLTKNNYSNDISPERTWKVSIFLVMLMLL